MQERRRFGPEAYSIDQNLGTRFRWPDGSGTLGRALHDGMPGMHALPDEHHRILRRRAYDCITGGDRVPLAADFEMDHRLIPKKIEWGETYPSACNLASKIWLARPHEPRSGNLPDLLAPELELVEPLIQPAQPEERAVASPFPDLPVLHDQDLVRMQNGAQPMGYDDAGSPGHELGDGQLDLRLRLCIDRAGSLVQNQDVWVQR